MSTKCAVEGWLIKKKGKDKNAFFSKDNLRYFKMQEVRGQDYAELAFAYFKTNKDKEARGWIYLKDITEIYDDEKAFTVVSAARTMTIEAQNPTEYMMWLQTLVEYCPNADTSGLRTNIASSKKLSVKTVQSKETSDESYQTLEALNARQPAGNKKNFSKSTSLFSRQADGENNSFYLPSQGIHKVYSSSHSDLDNTEQPSANYRKELLEDTDEDENNEVSGPSRSSNHSRTNSREFNNSRNQDREDHRKQGYRGSSSSSNTTNRLHQHISKESSASGVAGSGAGGGGNAKKKNLQRFPSELEEISLDNPTTASSNYRGTANGGGGGKKGGVGKKTNSDGSIYSLAEEEGEGDGYDDYNGSESGSNSPFSSSNHNNSSAYMKYSNESLVDPGEAVATSNRNGSEDFSSGGGAGLKKMQGANMSINIDSKEVGGPPPPVARASPTAAAGGAAGGGGGTGKRGMPTSAPPKKAVESLNQVEAVINSADLGSNGAAGSGKTRISIDELLYRKKVNTSAAAAAASSGADSKQEGGRSGGSKHSDDSDEEEVDFKAEMRHYSSNVTASTESMMSSGNASAAVSKPPRAPVSGKSPYAAVSNSSSSTSNMGSGHHHQPGRSTTPPRRPQDPGAKIDSNFVTDNWDEEEDDDNDNTRHRRRGGGGGGRPSHQPPHKAEDKAVAGRDQYGNAVKQDENWLEENFDDD